MSLSTERRRKAALVFGGSRGIGAAIVARLAQDGYAVAFTYLSQGGKAEELVRAVAAEGGDAFAIQADSADPAAIKAAVAKAVECFGPIDVLVVNAGILRRGTVDVFPLDELDLMLDVNVRGVFLAIQAATPHLADGGRVVTIGSCVAVRTGLAGTSVYQFTKAAVAAMVKGIALDLAPRRISVNNIQPGPTSTDLTAPAIEMLTEISPLRRVAQPQEIAGLVSYLATDGAGYMTGASLTIDGGLTL